MEDDDLLEPLPDLDGDDDEPEDDVYVDDGVAELLAGSDEDVGLDATAAVEGSEGLESFLDELPADDAGLDDAEGPEEGLGDLLDEADAEPPPLSVEGRDGDDWEQHSDLEEAPPLGVDDGGELGLEEPHLDAESDDADDVDLPALEPADSLPRDARAERG